MLLKSTEQLCREGLLFPHSKWTWGRQGAFPVQWSPEVFREKQGRRERAELWRAALGERHSRNPAPCLWLLTEFSPPLYFHSLSFASILHIELRFIFTIFPLPKKLFIKVRELWRNMKRKGCTFVLSSGGGVGKGVQDVMSLQLRNGGNLRGK